jgi:outer membrane receptor for ferrienterochelin and colicins
MVRPDAATDIPDMGFPAIPMAVRATMLAAVVLMAPATGVHAAGVADTVTVLPPVDINGQRPDTATRTTATQVKLNRGALNRFQPSTSGDAIAAVPGVELQKLGPWASRVSFRGLSGDRVLLMIDGVRINTTRGHGAQASLVSMNRLDEVDLLPGASSAQYGSDAMGGVINLITHRDLFSDQPRAVFTVAAGGSEPGYGWNQSARARMLFQNWGLELNGSGGGLGRLVTPEGTLENSGYHEQDWGARIGARTGAATFDLERTSHVARDVGLPAFNDDAGSYGSYPEQSRVADRFEVKVNGAGRRPEMRLLAVNQMLGVDFNETVADTTFRLGRPTAIIVNDSFDQTSSPAWSLQPELRFGGPLDARLSGEYRRENTSGPRLNRTTTTRSGVITAQSESTGVSIPPAQRDVASAALFVTRDLKLVRLEGGARTDWMRTQADEVVNSQPYHRDVTDQNLSGEAGVSRRFGAVEPYAHVASGFRGPNLEERYFHNTIHGGMRVFGNPDLVPETSMSYEVGVRTGEAWSGRITNVRVSAYRSNVEDMINLFYDGFDRGLPNFHYINIDRARIEGLELASQFRLGWLGAGLNVALPRGHDLATGDKLVDSGVARATLDLSVPVGVLPSAHFNTRVQWTDGITGDGLAGTQDTIDLLIRPAHWVESVELTSGFAGFLAMVSVRNLANLSYQEPLSFIPEPGRTVVFSLRKDFNVNLTNVRSTP